MDSKRVEQLLERYWRCETSVEEEALLRDYFCGDDVPRHLLRYKELFVYQQLQQEVRLGSDFDARVLAEAEADTTETPHVKARRVTLVARLMPLFKAAAVVAVALSLGNMMQHSFFTDVEEMAAADTIGKQISTPSVALTEEVATIHEQQVTDSLHPVKKEEEITE